MKKAIAMALTLALLTGLLAMMPVLASAETTMQPITFKFACAESEDTVCVQNLKAAFDVIAEKTGGAIQFEAYPSNQLGSINDVIEQVKAGAPIVELIGFGQMGDMISTFAPTAFPYTFQDLYELYALAKSDWMKARETEMYAIGIAPLAYGAGGYRHFISTKPIYDASSIKGLICRMGPEAAAQGFITVMGGTPTTSTWTDNYSLLQTGMIDSCEAAIDLLWNSSLYEVCDYLTLSGHFITPNLLIMNTLYWDQIPAEYQQILRDELQAAQIATTDNAVANQDQFVEKFKGAGVEVIETDKSTFAAYAGELYKLLNIDLSVYEDIRAAVEANQ